MHPFKDGEAYKLRIRGHCLPFSCWTLCSRLRRGRGEEGARPPSLPFPTPPLIESLLVRRWAWSSLRCTAAVAALPAEHHSTSMARDALRLKCSKKLSICFSIRFSIIFPLSHNLFHTLKLSKTYSKISFSISSTFLKILINKMKRN